MSAMEAPGAVGDRLPRTDGDCVCVDVDRCADEALTACGDVLYGAGRSGRARELLRRYPGCLIVVVREPRSGRGLAVTRTGPAATVCRVGGGPVRAGDLAAVARVLHAWMLAVRPPPGRPEPIEVAFLGRRYRLSPIRSSGQFS